jgi:hypothetical protein
VEPQLLTVAEGVYAWIGAGGLSREPDSSSTATDEDHY